MKAIPNFSHSEESPKIMAVYPPYAAEEVAICRDSELRAFIVHACNTSAAHEARIAALARDLSDAEIELRLCSELLGDYARGAVTDHAETFRRIGVASTVIANARAALASAKSP